MGGFLQGRSCTVAPRDAGVVSTRRTVRAWNTKNMGGVQSSVRVSRIGTKLAEFEPRLAKLARNWLKSYRSWPKIVRIWTSAR